MEGEEEQEEIKKKLNERQDSYFHPSRVPTLPKFPLHKRAMTFYHLLIQSPQSATSSSLQVSSNKQYNQYMRQKKKTHLTRRQITDRKIVQNIELFNDPADRIFHGDLSISSNNVYETTPLIKVLDTPNSFNLVNTAKHGLFVGITPGNQTGASSPDYLGLRSNASIIRGKKIQADSSKILLKAISSGDNLMQEPQQRQGTSKKEE